MKFVNNDGRYDHYLAIGDDQAILADVILEYYRLDIVVLHFCVFKRTGIDWHHAYKTRLLPMLPKEIKHIIIPFHHTNKARVRLFESYGFKFTYTEQEKLFIFHDKL